MKELRHRKILDIISENNVQTQEELISKLREAGFSVTQATVSRDIRELKLVKVSAGGNEYKYAESTHEDIKISAKYRNILKETMASVDYSGNIVVVKTYPGMAQAAATAIDNMGWDDIVGSVAGDDTIIIIMRANNSAIDFYDKFTEILKHK